MVGLPQHGRPPCLLLLLLPHLAGAEILHRGSQEQRGQAGNVEEMDTHSVLAALGLLSGSFLLIIVVLRVYLRCWRRPERVAKRKAVTAAEVEQRFPVTTGTQGEPTCVVCLSTIEADEPCRTTQCGHVFHADCVMEWWIHKPRKVLRCPICRQRQRKDPERRSRLKQAERQQAAAEAVRLEESTEGEANLDVAVAIDTESAEAEAVEKDDAGAAPEQESSLQAAEGDDVMMVTV